MWIHRPATAGYVDAMPRFVTVLGGTLDLHTGRTTLERGVRLTERECRVLDALVEAAPDGVARGELERVAGIATAERGVLDLLIRRLRSKIEPVPTAPFHLISVFNHGYRFVAAAGPQVSLGLPPERHALIGRSGEVDRVEHHLAASRLALVTGPGGIGKTALAIHVARRSPLPRVVFASARDADTVGALWTAVARAIHDPGVLAPSEDHVFERLVPALGRAGDTLVVLDDLEKLGGRVVSPIALLMQAAPQLRVLLTSRATLDAGYEPVAVRLGPLGYAEALAMWTDRVPGSVDPAVPALLEALERSPLAIELAAARATALTPAAMLARMDQRFRLLDRGPRDDPKHRSLRATLDWSWRLLAPPAQQALVQLAVFVGPVDEQRWADVADDPAEIEALVDASLAQRGPAGIEVASSVREYALGTDPARVQVAEDRHARAWARWLDALRGPLDADRLDRVDGHLPDLLATGRAAGRVPDEVIAIALGLHDRHQARGPIEPYLALVDRALEAAADHPRRVDLLRERGECLRQLGRLAEAAEVVDQLALADPARPWRAAGLRGVVALEQGRRPEAIAALEVARDAPDPRERSLHCSNLAAALAWERPDDARIELLAREAIGLASDLGQAFQVAAFRANFGAWLFQTGRLAEAAAETERAVDELLRFQADRRVIPAVLTLAAAWAELGRLQEARALQVTHALRAERARPWVITYWHLLSAQLHLEAGEPEEALSILPRSEAQAERVGDRAGAALARLHGAVAAARLGRLAEAESALSLIPAGLLADRVVWLAREHLALAAGRSLSDLGPPESDGTARHLRRLLEHAARR